MAQSCASVPPERGLDIEKGVVFIVVAGEHTAEFELCQLRFQLVDITLHLVEGVLIALFAGQFQQIDTIRHSLLQSVQGVDHLFQCGPFAVEVLRPFLIVPDVRVFQFAEDFYQPL